MSGNSWVYALSPEHVAEADRLMTYREIKIVYEWGGMERDGTVKNNTEKPKLAHCNWSCSETSFHSMTHNLQLRSEVNKIQNVQNKFYVAVFQYTRVERSKTRVDKIGHGPRAQCHHYCLDVLPLIWGSLHLPSPLPLRLHTVSSWQFIAWNSDYHFNYRGAYYNPTGPAC